MAFQISRKYTIGWLHLFSNGKAITRIDFAEAPMQHELPCDLLEEAHQQLHDYFGGNRQQFSLPLQPKGTEFQRRIWELLEEIPFSETTSYQTISERYGNVKAIRAVGQAIGKNPIAIVIPCHRVIGKNGSLTGFAGGLERKKVLLECERIKDKK